MMLSNDFYNHVTHMKALQISHHEKEKNPSWNGLMPLKKEIKCELNGSVRGYRSFNILSRTLCQSSRFLKAGHMLNPK